MKIYCSSCGNDNSYTTNKPNFCQKCGTSFSAAKASNTTSPEEALALPPEGEDAQSVPPINELDFDIVGNGANRGISLGALSQIAQREGGSAPQKSPKKKVPRVSKKKVLEQFLKEAGAIRPKNG